MFTCLYIFCLYCAFLSPPLSLSLPPPAGSYMVLEGYGGSGESSTDDDVQGSSIEPTAAGDSGIDLKKLLSSSSSQSGGPNLSRQVMTHLRLLQANLQHLKVSSAGQGAKSGFIQ